VFEFFLLLPYVLATKASVDWGVEERSIEVLKKDHVDMNEIECRHD